LLSSLHRKVIQMFEGLKKKYPLLFREKRHAGEGGVICTSCDCRIKVEEIVKEGKHTVLEGVEVDLYFCRGCSDSAKSKFPDDPPPPPFSEKERIEKMAEHEKNGDPLITCSFCTRNQFEARFIFSVLRYYQTGKFPKGRRIHPVTNDNFFLSTHGDQNPKRIGELFICGACAVGEP
jgi:hypothetical protein